jgi:glyoxylase-like metal-dependent hydrolase (beta-lactamase superfamily II)
MISLRANPKTLFRLHLQNSLRQDVEQNLTRLGKRQLHLHSLQQQQQRQQQKARNKLARFIHKSSRINTPNTPSTPGLTKGRASYSTKACEPTIHHIFENNTGTWQYVVADTSTSTCVIIDSVLNYDRATQIVTFEAAEALLSLVKDKGYKVNMILETHAHADHLTAASYLQHRLVQEQGYRPHIGVGKRIGQVQNLFGERYGIPAEEYKDVFDKLFDDDEVLQIGNLTATILHLPGHTPDHVGYQIGGILHFHHI